MSITKFIVSKIDTEKKKEDRSTNNSCMICGGKTTNDRFFVDKKQIFSAKFNDIGELINKNSNMICGYCQFCLDGKAMISPKGKPCGMRLYSFYVDENEFKVIDRSEREYYLFEKKYDGDFIIAFSDTGQKHISFKSKISTDGNSFYVCTDTGGNILFEREKRKDIYIRSKELYELGVPKKALLGDIDPRRMKKYGLGFGDFQTIKRYENNSAYKVVIDSLTKKK